MEQAPSRRSATSRGWRSRRAALAVVATTLTVGAFAALSGAGGTSTATSTPAGSLEVYKVASSLDGMTNLPLRARWVAYPTMPKAGIMVPQDDVDRVEFFIDGKLRWYAQKYPFTFGGWAGHLVTTWLSPGKHTFTATLVTVDGKRTSNTVVANVAKAPAPPAALAGRWTQQKNENDLTPEDRGRGLTGRWDLVFDEIGAWTLDPVGGGAIEHIKVFGDTITVLAPIEMAGRDAGRAAYGAQNVRGPLCPDGGPGVRQWLEGTFKWSVTGDKLTILAPNPGCPPRGALWGGTWTRVKSGPPRGPLTP